MEFIIIGKGFLGNSLYSNLKKKFKVKIYGMRELKLQNKNFSSKSKLFVRKSTTLILATGIARIRQNNIISLKKNIIITKNLEFFFKKKYIKKIIFLSSIDIYKKNLININENSFVEANDNYSLSKIISESLLLDMSKKYKKTLMIFRLPGIYGKNDQNQSLIGNFMHKAKNKKKLTIFNNGNTTRDFLNIKDFLNLVIILSNLNKSIILNLVTGKKVKISQLCRIIKNFIPQAKIIYSNKKDVRDYNISFDNKKLINLTNYSFINIKDAIKDYIN